MDRKVIKLETAHGSERNWLIVKRSHDLIVRNIMEDIQKQFKIPMDEQVVFHKGKNLCDYPNETLENLGIENNNLIRITRDPELPNKSPRARASYVETTYAGNFGGPNGMTDVNYPGDMSQRPADPYQPYQYK
jgi:hypothetical protein